MPRIVGIDFGTKRTGIAATDPHKIIVSPVATLSTDKAMDFLKEYIAKEEVESIVCGHPGHQNVDLVKELDAFVEQLSTSFPSIPVIFQDEHLSSRRASGIILKSGLGRMKRRDKSLIDKVSAVLILQEYLGHLNDVHST